MSLPHSAETCPPARLRELLARFAGRRIVIIGDAVADHYIVGKTSRISREAPVLILKYQGEHTVPGQAANTAANLATLGGATQFFALVGQDKYGAMLCEQLVAQGVNCAGVGREPSYPTLTKTRIMAGAHHTGTQQLLRMDDDERPDGPPAAARAAMKPRLLAAIAQADAVVVCDYGYGLVDRPLWAELLAAAGQRPVVLDSRYRFTELKGATLITPNEGEAVACCGLSTESHYDVAAIGAEVLRRTEAKHLLITRGNEGMALFDGEGTSTPVRHLPIFGAEEAADVTGAGDTVVAAAALALAAGATPLEAATLANIAGGLVVMKMGTATLTVSEMLTAL